jgi:CHAD domain-containing protein
MGADEDLDAGTAVMRSLRAIGERMPDLETAALADEPDAVHQFRTHVRRIRSMLGAFTPVFDEAPVVSLRRRYRELGAELGVVRDIEVRVEVAERALGDIGEQGIATDTVHWQEVRARLVDAERAEYALAHARFADRQQLPRARARRDELEAFLVEPLLAPRAVESAREVLRDLIEDEARRALRRARRLDGGGDEAELHEVRKAGRRLRYAAEAVTSEPVELFGGQVRKLAEVGDDLHDVLGDHRDEVLFAEHARRAGAHVAHEGGASLLFEQLAAAADERAADHLRRLPDVIDRLRDLVAG